MIPVWIIWIQPSLRFPPEISRSSCGAIVHSSGKGIQELVLRSGIGAARELERHSIVKGICVHLNLPKLIEVVISAVPFGFGAQRRPAEALPAIGKNHRERSIELGKLPQIEGSGTDIAEFDHVTLTQLLLQREVPMVFGGHISHGSVTGYTRAYFPVQKISPSEIRFARAASHRVIVGRGFRCLRSVTDRKELVMEYASSASQDRSAAIIHLPGKTEPGFKILLGQQNEGVHIGPEKRIQRIVLTR